MTKPYPNPVRDELSGRRALVTGGSRGIGAAIARRLIDGGATVVTTARARTAPVPPILHYAAAKAALLAYSAGLAKELAPKGIRVNAVLPGQVDTPGGTELMQTIADGIGAPLEALRAAIPLGRVGDPRDIAEMVAFLVSDRAQWITGENFVVAGAVDEQSRDLVNG